VPWFPWVGLLLGAVVGATWWTAAEAFGPLTAAALVVAVDLALTGMLHLDGTVDSADGLLPHLVPLRRLEVMAEPGVGAFGVGAGVTVLLLRVAALAETDARPLTVVALWTASRALMAVAVVWLPRVRPGGMAATVGGAARQPVAVSVGMALVVAVIALVGAPGGPLPLLGLAAGAGVLVLGLRRLGGVTGDVVGAAGLAAETTGLVLAAARW
jgi:adenosylcobinamide-GDP ribazoletransferase